MSSNESVEGNAKYRINREVREVIISMMSYFFNKLKIPAVSTLRPNSMIKFSFIIIWLLAFKVRHINLYLGFT